MQFDRTLYFNAVRSSLFAGTMSQDQVDGQEAILSEWEADAANTDIRHLGYELATTYHETSKEMQPIEEYGKGSGQPYGKKDPETGQCYYGRGFVQLTWRDNYARADRELGLTKATGMEWTASRALDPDLAALVMFRGMEEGWFRASSDGRRQTLDRYFNASTEDAYTAREIINGDKSTVPSWSNGVSIGNLIAGYYGKFRSALGAAATDDGPTPPAPDPTPPTPAPGLLALKIALELEIKPGETVSLFDQEENPVGTITLSGGTS